MKHLNKFYKVKKLSFNVCLLTQLKQLKKTILLPCLLLVLAVQQSPAQEWKQIGSDIEGEAAGNLSGMSVSLSKDGSIMAIGAIGINGNGVFSGHVRVYQNIAGSWKQIGQDIDGEAAGDYSGWSVSLSADGSIVAIGAYKNDGNGSSSGHVRIYQYKSGSWKQIGQDIDGEAAGDYSGRSVSLSADGSIVAIGAPGNDGDGFVAGAGHVRVYKRVDLFITSFWKKMGKDIDGVAPGDGSGCSVSLSANGSVVAIGSPNNSGNGSYAGHVRIFKYCYLNGWIKVGEIDGEAPGDGSGCSVSLSANGSRVAIGSPENDGNGSSEGHVRVYRNFSGSWKQIGQDIDGEDADDYSGHSVCLSSDGSRVAIGAYGNDGNGYAAGHVRVYRYEAGTWTQIGSDIDGEESGDNSGFSVSLSADGSRVAIGSPGNDGNGSYAGCVRAFQYTSSTKSGIVNEQQNLEGNNTQLSLGQEPLGINTVTKLINYPNPFNGVTTIEFTLTNAAEINLEVFNMDGKSVKQLINEYREAGPQSISFDATNLPDGIYFYRLKSNNEVITNKMILQK